MSSLFVQNSVKFHIFVICEIWTGGGPRPSPGFSRLPPYLRSLPGRDGPHHAEIPALIRRVVLLSRVHILRPVVLYDSPGTVRMNARQFSNTYSMGYPSPSKLIR